MNQQPVQLKCPHCGFVNATGSMFCGSCGEGLTSKCRRCWTPNALGTSFCSRCGVELAKATFGMPSEIAEQWAAKFAGYKWSRQVNPTSAQLLRTLNPPFDRTKETIIATCGIVRDTWLVQVIASGRSIYSSKRDHQAGTMVLTNWRGSMSNCV